MTHIGICYGHNATVAVIRDGKLIFCQSEERLNRIKNSTGFPFKTLEHVYAHVAAPEEIRSATLFQKSAFGYLHLKEHNFEPYQYGFYLDPEIHTTGIKQVLLQSEMGWHLKRKKIEHIESDAALRAEKIAYFSKAMRLPENRVYELDHHLSHAFSVIPNVRSWGRALIFTLDGVGDWACATVNVVENGIISVLQRTDHRNSIGYYYAAVTALLGMKAGEHEFKVMGLAPYARSQYYQSLVEKLSTLIRIDSDGDWKSKVNPAQLQKELEKLFRYQRFDNIAGAIQALTEKLILDWIHYWIDRTGICDIGLAGGVFMNVKACQQVVSSSKVGRCFVMPSAADESTAIGAAVWGSTYCGDEPDVEPLKDLYLGMNYSNAEVEQAISDLKASEHYEITEPEDINDTIGSLLADNCVVARCSGPMEFGARALGNRSILANPSDFGNLQLINDAIKSRDFWMPFTPSILAEQIHRYVQNHDRIFAPYMCITFDSTQEARKDLKAAIHPRDFTLRPQCVLKEWNLDYHAIISAFHQRTGIGGVLNTSFNLHGEPNVCSPADAIRTVDNSGLQYLAMNHLLLKKKR